MFAIVTPKDFRRDLWDGNREWISPALPIRRWSCKWFWLTGNLQSVQGGLFSQTDLYPQQLSTRGHFVP